MITGNLAVIAVVAKYRKMRTVTNIFITQLAIGDLFIVLFCMPFSMPQTYLVGVSYLFVPFIPKVYLMGWGMGRYICIPFKIDLSRGKSFLCALHHSSALSILSN